MHSNLEQSGISWCKVTSARHACEGCNGTPMQCHQAQGLAGSAAHVSCVIQEYTPTDSTSHKTLSLPSPLREALSAQTALAVNVPQRPLPTLSWQPAQAGCHWVLLPALDDCQPFRQRAPQALNGPCNSVRTIPDRHDECKCMPSCDTAPKPAPHNQRSKLSTLQPCADPAEGKINI